MLDTFNIIKFYTLLFFNTLDFTSDVWKHVYILSIFWKHKRYWKIMKIVNSNKWNSISQAKETYFAMQVTFKHSIFTLYSKCREKIKIELLINFRYFSWFGLAQWYESSSSQTALCKSWY